MAASISFTNLDIQQALDSQKSKAAGTCAERSAETSKSAERPQLRRDEADAEGQRKSHPDKRQVGRRQRRWTGAEESAESAGDRQPGSGRVIKNHPELFSNPDTDIQLASLTFVLEGPRITSHDIKVQTVDYNLLGDGWFDMDKNIDLAARIVLSAPFSKELIEQQKQEVAFIANKDGTNRHPAANVGQLPSRRSSPM